MALFAVMILAPLVFALPVTGARADSPTVVQINGKVSGFNPVIDFEELVTITANVQGTFSSLTGRGVDHWSSGLTLVWTVAGSTDGSTVTLSGEVIQASCLGGRCQAFCGGPIGCLVGSPVQLVASTDGPITFTLGPFEAPRGPLVGVTLVFTGTGTVLISK